MKIIERAVLAILALIVLFALHQVVGSLVERHNWKGLSASDWAAWVQAVGSITALGVAIFVMSKQNRHAASLIVDADKLALRRRGNGVQAVLVRAQKYVQRTHAATRVAPINPQHLAILNREIETGAEVIGAIAKTIRTIPVYELGSYQMADAVQELSETLEAYAMFLAAMSTGQVDVTDPLLVNGVEAAMASTNQNIAKFELGFAESR